MLMMMRLGNTTACYSEQGMYTKGQLMAATIKYCSATVSLLIVYVCPDHYLDISMCGCIY